jgi:DNA-directed RNA polymerase specialized sigma24 family protein
VAPTPDRPPDAQTTACPCRHGDLTAELAGQRPLLERAAAGDREAFALLYDDQVEGVYRYLLAWTGDRPAAADLTRQVFLGALGWLPPTTDAEGEAGAWLIAMARDAAAQRHGSGGTPGPAGPAGAAAGPAGGVVAAVARLGAPEREVVVLRLLLGHSLDHTAHLSGYRRRAVLELQLAACLAVSRLTGAGADAAAPAPPQASAEDFERRLGRWDIDLTGTDPTGTDPTLADALSVARSLRQSIPGYVVAPDLDFVLHLRHDLLTTAVPDPEPALPDLDSPLPDPEPPLPDPEPALTHPDSLLPDPEPALTHPVQGRVPRWGSVADGGAGRSSLSTGRRGGWLLRRPWVSTGVAAVGIVVMLTLQAFGDPAPPPACGGRPCPPPTTVAAAAGGSNLGTALTTIVEPSTTSSTVAGPAPSTPLTSAASAPQTTRPAPTAPPSTSAPRPTTTRAPTTTAPTTTVAATTTTVAPAPT